MKKHIEIFEVGPRDGFQNIDINCCKISTEKKVEIIKNIIDSGIEHIEYTSFVNPKAIPQLADASEITKTLKNDFPNLDMFPLVPNLKGASLAYDLGIRKVLYVVSLSTSHNKANINRTHEQSLEEYKLIKKTYPDLEVLVSLATTFGCPFEGKYRTPNMAINFLKDYIDNGLKICCLCDTIGIADPEQVEIFIKEIKETYPDLELMVHFHDTRGLGMVNTLTAIRNGVTISLLCNTTNKPLSIPKNLITSVCYFFFHPLILFYITLSFQNSSQFQKVFQCPYMQKRYHCTFSTT